MKRWLLAVLLVCVLAPACKEETGLISGTGTITQSSVECQGVWFITADSGRHYQLTALDAAFQKEGLRVRFSVRERQDVATICMAGPVADVVSITKL